MAFTKFYILTEEQLQTLINGGQVEGYSYDANAIYYTDKISADQIDDSNSTKKMVTATQAAAWTAAATAQGDWNETDSTSKAYIKNKPTIPTPNYPVVDVLVSTDGSTYTSIVDNKEARLDLSGYLIASNVKTINGNSLIGSGNINIDEIAYINCTSSASGQPTSPNTSGKLKLVLYSDTTASSINKQEGYWYLKQKSSS